jgi:hypothetical protein
MGGIIPAPGKGLTEWTSFFGNKKSRANPAFFECDSVA